MYFSLFVGVLCLSLFCYALLCVHFRYALNQMHMYYLLPIVEYASVVWDGCSDQDSQTLQNIQNETARLVTGLARSVSLESLYN